MATSCNQRQLVRLHIYSEHLAENSGNKYIVTEESRLWSNQTVVSYFFDAAGQESHDEREAFVIAAMKEYTKYTSIKFVPSKDRSSASIRITFSPKDKHWVAIGTDALMIDPEKATMNLAWIDPGELSATNSVIALHAIGHVLGLVHENLNPPVSNFPEYDKDSIMRYSDTTTINATVKRGVVPQLSNCDKAWLTLNYPRAPTKVERGAENTDTLEHMLEVLGIDGESSSKILKTSDMSERRFLYSQSKLRNARSEATDRDTLGELTQKIPDYPDVLLKLQSQLGPKAVPGRNVPGAPPRPADVKKYILDFLRVLRSSGGSSTPAETQESERFSEIIPALLEFMEMVGSGDPSEGPIEAPITQEELDDLQRQLSTMLDSSPNNEPINVEHGILTELPGIRNILDWFSRTASESRTDVRKISSAVADKMLDMLRKSPPRDVFQEVYHLCFASYYVHDVNGTRKALQVKHQQLLESILPKISSRAETGATATNGWELVWGPVVWKVKPKDDSGGPDLAWYIAHNGSFVSGDDDEPRPTYVIAIAGTQSRSVHTWLNSNFDVTFPVDFKGWVSVLRSNPYNDKLPKAMVKWKSPYIARGTARTVWQLLTEAAPRGAKAEGQSLLDFLKSKSKSNPDLRIITTGHSLGGALCPTLAVVLVEVDVVLRDRILTYPIAGPSPGNDAFAKYFAETLQPIPANKDDLKTRNYQVWNLNIVNAHDPVPQAWCSDEQACPEQNLLNIKNMIPGSYIKSVFSAIISNVLSDLLGAKLRYMPLQSQIFFPPPSESFKQVRPQHTDAYHKAKVVSEELFWKEQPRKLGKLLKGAEELSDEE